MYPALVAALLSVLLQPTPTRTLGFLPEALPEASGLARSHRYPGALWLINDGDHKGQLHLWRPQQPGVIQSWPVSGMSLRDWEGLTSFQRGGQNWLAIGDIGDNEGLHDHLSIGLLVEPATEDQEAVVLRQLRFTLPGGPADIETLMYDSGDDQFLLVTKRERPPRLLTLSLDGPDGSVQKAGDAGPLSGYEPPASAAVAADPRMGRWLNQPTGGDISPDGHRLALLTYDRIHLYSRPDNGRWATVLQHPAGRVLDFARLPQQEALSFLDDDTIVITSENLPAPLLSLPVTHD